MGCIRAAPYLFLIPVVTGIMSAAVLGEAFTPARIGGALLVLVGTTLVRVLGMRVAASAANADSALAPPASVAATRTAP